MGNERFLGTRRVSRSQRLWFFRAPFSLWSPNSKLKPRRLKPALQGFLAQSYSDFRAFRRPRRIGRGYGTMTAIAVDCAAPLDGVAVTVTVYAPAVVPGFPPPLLPPLLPQFAPTTTTASIAAASKTTPRRFFADRPSRNIEARTAQTSPIRKPLGAGPRGRLAGT